MICFACVRWRTAQETSCGSAAVKEQILNSRDVICVAMGADILERMSMNGSTKCMIYGGKRIERDSSDVQWGRTSLNRGWTSCIMRSLLTSSVMTLYHNRLQHLWIDPSSLFSVARIWGCALGNCCRNFDGIPRRVSDCNDVQNFDRATTMSISPSYCHICTDGNRWPSRNVRDSLDLFSLSLWLELRSKWRCVKEGICGRDWM